MKINELHSTPLVRLRWLTVAALEIKVGDTTFVIDPYVTASTSSDLTAGVFEGADYILISHTHYDHITDINYLMEKFGAKVLCGQLSADPLTKWLDCNPIDVYPMTPGLEVDFGAAKVKALYGRHSNLGKPFSAVDAVPIEGTLYEKPGVDLQISRQLRWLGVTEYTNYLITLPNGLRIVFYGGFDLPEARIMLRDIRPDILITQFTAYNSHTFSEFVSAIAPKYVIPHHMDYVWPPEQYEARFERCGAMLAEKCPGTTLITPEQGKWYEFSMGVSPVK